MAVRPDRYGAQGFALRGEKNRFALPPDFRNAVVERSGERVLCLAKHEKWNCLTGFDLSNIDGFEAKLDEEEERAAKFGRDFDRDLRAMQLYGFTRVPFDASGRFILPDFLSDLGNLRGAVYLHGSGETFTLWNPDELEAMGDAFAGARATCRNMHQAALAKGKKK